MPAVVLMILGVVAIRTRLVAGRFPWIIESALKNQPKQFVIDEAVILRVDGIADFNALHSRARRRRMTFIRGGNNCDGSALPQCNLVTRQNESPLSN
jgi:hypothetical protein